MAGEFQLTDIAAQALAEAFIAALGPNAYGEIYTAPLPADPNEAPSTQVLLGTLTMGATAGMATDGVVTLNPISQDPAADASGEMAWCRWHQEGGAAVCNMAISDLSGSGPMKFSTTTVVEGGPISIDDDPDATIDFHGA